VIDTSIADRPEWEVEAADRTRSADARDVRWQITELRARIAETDPLTPPTVKLKIIGR
jgi:hypothetical protein